MRSWSVEWRLKKDATQKRRSAPVTRAQAVAHFRRLRAAGYPVRISELRSGPLAMQFIMASHEWPYFKRLKGGVVVEKERMTHVDPSLESELQEGQQ